MIRRCTGSFFNEKEASSASLICSGAGYVSPAEYQTENLYICISQTTAVDRSYMQLANCHIMQSIYPYSIVVDL